MNNCFQEDCCWIGGPLKVHIRFIKAKRQEEAQTGNLGIIQFTYSSWKSVLSLFLRVRWCDSAQNNTRPLGTHTKWCVWMSVRYTHLMVRLKERVKIVDRRHRICLRVEGSEKCLTIDLQDVSEHLQIQIFNYKKYKKRSSSKGVKENRSSTTRTQKKIFK